MAFYGVRESGINSGCENTVVCGMHTASPASVRSQRCTASSVIRKPELSACIGGGKNAMRCLWRAYPLWLVRSAGAPSARSALRRHTDLLGVGCSARRVQGLRQGEAGEAGLAGGPSVLHQAFRLLRRTTLPGHDDQRRRPGDASGLVDRQEAGNGVHAGTIPQSGEPGAPRKSGSTRSPSGRGTTTASSSAISIAGGQSGSAVRAAPKPTWTSSLPRWDPKTARIQLAAMDMWKPFRASLNAPCPTRTCHLRQVPHRASPRRRARRGPPS